MPRLLPRSAPESISASVACCSAPDAWRRSDDEVFELVNQFNRGLDLLADAGKRDLVRRLNLRAGRKSRAAIAYAATREYLAQASALLPADAWTTNYAEAFATKLELAECEYLLGHFEQVKSLFSEIIEKAGNDLDRANALCLRVRLYDTSGRLRDALEAGIEALRLLGFAIPDAEEDISRARGGGKGEDSRPAERTAHCGAGRRSGGFRSPGAGEPRPDCRHHLHGLPSQAGAVSIVCLAGAYAFPQARQQSRLLLHLRRLCAAAGGLSAISRRPWPSPTWPWR